MKDFVLIFEFLIHTLIYSIGTRSWRNSGFILTCEKKSSKNFNLKMFRFLKRESTIFWHVTFNFKSVDFTNWHLFMRQVFLKGKFLLLLFVFEFYILIHTTCCCPLFASIDICFDLFCSIYWSNKNVTFVSKCHFQLILKKAWVFLARWKTFHFPT